MNLANSCEIQLFVRFYFFDFNPDSRCHRADVFPFEDREINYSCRKLIEYTGEELNDVTMYWAVEEFLYPGEYRVDIFADNYKIGTRSFTLKQ